MISFNPEDPYPLLDETEAVSLNARQHARSTDEWLGLQVLGCEEAIRAEFRPSHQEIWAQTDPQVFLTPYLEFRLILSLLDPLPTSSIVDLGAAYCRLAFVMQRHYPEVNFVGIECVERRVLEAQRLFALHGLTRAQVLCADLTQSSFEIPIAEHYFVYDFGSRQDIAGLLERLREIQRRGKQFKLVARGLRTRECVEDLHRAWLFKEGPIYRESEFAIYSTV